MEGGLDKGSGRKSRMDECAHGGKEERRKCSEVDQPRVKQALVEQVMHATFWSLHSHANVFSMNSVRKWLRRNNLLFKTLHFSKRQAPERTNKGLCVHTNTPVCFISHSSHSFRGRVLIQRSILGVI